ncbi:MAG: putative DNA binding domain-containing protein [Gammaproteobacteria bacterium]|nr:putative DNA binding domain-containing protein [Gammaproteobacteria bacterium]
MKPLSDIELEALLDDLESDRVERKESWSGDCRDKGGQAVCAFANDLPNHEKPGVLFVGAKDDGEPSGLPITDELLRTLADLRSNGNIVPPPSCTVEKRRLKNAEMAVVAVQPADAPPVRYRGRIWIRTGPRRDIATAQDERILNEKRRHRDRTFDSHPVVACPMAELNRVVFEQEYLPRAVAGDVLTANARSYEERLASTGMIVSVEDLTPTVTGVLTLGKTPRTWLPCAYVQFLRINGTEWGDPVVDEQELDGTLDLIIRRLDEKLKAHLTVAVDFTSGTTTETRRSPYPLVALQQLTRNAILHRTYEGTNAPVRVYWFDDRIEIHSPGGPFGSVTRENFGQPGKADYRNPRLAEVMKTLGFAQRFGFGIADARKALAENGNPPLEFQVEPTVVLATMRRTP